jgi:hypothetical protein
MMDIFFVVGRLNLMAAVFKIGWKVLCLKWLGMR